MTTPIDIARWRELQGPGDPVDVDRSPCERPSPRPAAECLRDIGEISFGLREVTSARDMVDNRRPVQDTALYPWSAIAHLSINTALGPFRATGWFIAPRAIVTAGHALYVHAQHDAAGSGWVESVAVTPVDNGGAAAQSNPILSSSFACMEGWIQHGDERSNIGVIFLDKPSGESRGRLLFDHLPDWELIGAPANVVGYPCERPDIHVPDGLLWHSSRRIVRVDGSFVYYGMAAAPGQSGSPVYRNFGRYPKVFALHSYAASGTDVGLRLTEQICLRLREWRLRGLAL